VNTGSSCSGDFKATGDTTIPFALAAVRSLSTMTTFVGFAGLNKAAMVVALGNVSRWISTSFGVRSSFNVAMPVVCPPRPGKASDQARFHRGVDPGRDDRHGWTEGLGRSHGLDRRGQNHARAGLCKLACHLGEALIFAGGEAGFENVVSALDHAIVAQPLFERVDLPGAIGR
jgi:hypothetical protein